MPRIPIAAGNWKMHFGPRQAEEFAHLLRTNLVTLVGVEVVIFPPFLSIPATQVAVQGSNISLGAQNCADQPGGAYTGEVSATMVAECCRWVILGHSERRGYYGETNAIVNRKIRQAILAGLRPIICVGERLEQREAKQTSIVIEDQINACLSEIANDEIERVVFAYEPIWAIGTGRAATSQDATDVIDLIRALVTLRFGTAAGEAIRILYGGSVTAQNIGEFILSPTIDGALVGGASLKPEFVDIARAIAEAKRP